MTKPLRRLTGLPATLRCALTRESHGERADRELLAILYGSLPKAVLAVAVNATVLAVVLWPHAEAGLVGAWWALVAALCAGRLGLWHAWRRQDGDLRVGPWWKAFALGAGLTAVVWGTGTVALFGQVPLGLQLLMVIMAVGITSGAITTLSADTRLALFYLYALLIPLTAAFLLHGGDLYRVLALLGAFYMAMVTLTTRQYHRTLVDSVLHRISLEEAQAGLEAREQETRRLFDETPAGIFYYDNHLRLADCNPAFCRILHAPRDSLLGIDLSSAPDPRILPALEAALAGRDGRYDGPCCTTAGGCEIWVDLHCTPLRDGSGGIIGGIATVQDKTRERAALEEVTRLAFYDPLTGLPNRKLLEERIGQLLREEHRTERHGGLLFLDLDDFKRVNDTFGHAVGDRLLQQAALRLQKVLREEDTLGRLGGDEFVVLLPNLGPSTEKAMHAALAVAERIHTLLAEPLHLGEHTAYTSTSIGALTIDSRYDTEEHLRRADTAMYRAKARGKAATAFYDAGMDAAARSYHELVHELREALAQGAFELHYQPVVDAASGRVVAAEALVRWRHPERGLLSPCEFIPVAEEAGLVPRLGDWVLGRACAQWAAWARSGAVAIDYLTVNVSTLELRDAAYVDKLRACLEAHGVPPGRIRLEVTESLLAEDLARTADILQQITDLGVLCVLDDFGTGYSSLAYLKRLPFSALKIDRSYIHGMLEDADSGALVRTMVEIASQFSYGVVAEGVEQEAQRQALVDLHPGILCQGNLCGPPMPAARFETLAETCCRPHASQPVAPPGHRPPGPGTPSPRPAASAPSAAGAELPPAAGGTAPKSGPDA